MNTIANKPMKFKGDGYESVICEHHRDIVVCSNCDIFKDGYRVTFDGGWYMKFLHPFIWWKFKREARHISLSKERES